MRIPKRSRSFTLEVNGKEVSATPENGYIYIDLLGKTEIKLSLDGTPRFVRASNKVPRLTGMTAHMRGPLVYCFESADNGDVRSLRIDRSQTPSVGGFEPRLLGGTVKLTAKAFRTSDCDDLYCDEAETLTPCDAVAVPYYTWGNRGEGDMRVWVNTI